MLSRVMRLVASVCVCVHMWPKNQPAYSALLFKKSCCVYYTTCSRNLNASKVVFYVQQVVQTKQFVRVLFNEMILATNAYSSSRYKTLWYILKNKKTPKIIRSMMRSTTCREQVKNSGITLLLTFILCGDLYSLL